MLKPVRRLVLSMVVTVLVAGCGVLPTTSPTAQPAPPTAGSAAGSPAPSVTNAPPSPAPPRPSPSPSPSPSPVPRTTVRVGITDSLGGWIIDIADRQGMLASQNLVLDRKEADPGSTAAAEQVENRDRDIGVVSTDRLVQVGRDGQALVMVAGLVNKNTHALIAARDVEDFAGLKGKPVGHLDARSASAAIVKRILKARGISENDAPLITFRDPGVVGAAIANGTVGASLVDAARVGPYRNSGFKVLAEGADVAKDFQAEGLVVRPEWARQNEDTLVRFLRATVLAERWITASANRGMAIDLLAKFLEIDPSEARIVFEQYVEKQPSIPREGDIDQAGVRGVIELLAEVDAAGNPRPDPARLTDTTYLQRAKATLPR